MWMMAGTPEPDNKGKFPCPARGDAMMKKCKLVGDGTCPCDVYITGCQVQIVTKPKIDVSGCRHRV